MIDDKQRQTSVRKQCSDEADCVFVFSIHLKLLHCRMIDYDVHHDACHDCPTSC